MNAMKGKTIFDELKYLSIENGYILNSAFQRYEVFEIEGLDCYFKEQNFSAALIFSTRNFQTQMYRSNFSQFPD